ncbi:MAG: hypothetical protein EA387_01270 [Nitriliruptor sp.]|nr:MAG: hypothetical protein EA387_01270 [Nitriliruptor sp.]
MAWLVVGCPRSEPGSGPVAHHTSVPLRSGHAMPQVRQRRPSTIGRVAGGERHLPWWTPHGGATIDEIETRTLEEQDTAVVRSRLDASELTSWLSGVYGTLTLHLQRIGVPVIGQPFVRYHERGRHLDVEAGLPTAERITPKDEVKLSSLPGGTVATIWHHGAPEEADRAFEALETWMQQRGVEPLGAPWAVHHIDPTALPERGSWQTELIWPFRE